MKVKITERIVDGEARIAIHSVIVDTDKIDLSLKRGKSMFAWIQGIVARLDRTEVFKAENLIYREVLLGNIWHKHLKKDTWLSQFKEVLASEQTESDVEIYYDRDFSGKKEEE